MDLTPAQHIDPQGTVTGYGQSRTRTEDRHLPACPEFVRHDLTEVWSVRLVAAKVGDLR